MKKLLIIGMTMCSAIVSSQTVTIVDDDNGLPVDAVAIYNKEQALSAITNKKGEADISVFSDKEEIIISHVSYTTINTTKEFLKTNNFRVRLIKKTAQLNEIVLSVFKSKEKTTRIAEQTVAISKEDIIRESPQTSADLLGAVPGVKVQKSQFGGGSPVLRGMESNRVLLVVDGVRMNNAIYRKGHLQNSITIAPSLLERTEIVFGPSSVIYGSDALGGVIHYYTKTPKLSEKNSVKSELFSRYSSVNQEITNNVSAELNFEKWASYTNVSYSTFGDLQMGKNRSHGFKDWGLVSHYSENIGDNYAASPTLNSDPTIQRNTGYSQLDVLQKFFFPISKKADVTVNLQYSTSSNIPRFDKLTELKKGNLKFAEWYYGPQKRFLASTQLAINPNKSWVDKGVFTLAYQKIHESRIQRKFGSLDRLYRNEGLDVFSINGDFTVPLTNEKNRNLSYGFEFTYNDVMSVRTGKTLRVSNGKVTGFSGDFTVQSRYPDGGSSYASSAIYTDYRQDITPKATLNTGIRLTNTVLKARWVDQTFITLPQTEITLKNSAITATLGYAFRPTEDWQLNSVLSSGFRSPNIDDVGKVREKNGKVTLPNISLKPEFAYNAEVGILKFFNKKRFSLGLNTYYTLLDNYITREADGTQIQYDGETGDVVKNINKGQAYITGYTISYQGRINENWKTLGFLTYTKGESYDTKERMSSIPPLFGRFEVSYRKEKLELSANYRFNAKKHITTYNISEGIDNHVQTPIVNKNAINDVDKYYGTPSWFTVGLQGRYNVSQYITIQGALSNIFDEHYKEFASGISAPGRNFSVAVHAIF